MITKEKCKELRIDINKALESVGSKYNMKLEAFGITYSDNTVNIKLTGGLISADGEVANKESNTLKLLYPHLVNKEVKMPGASALEVKIIGYNSGASKYPFIVTDINGRRYKVSKSQLGV